VLSPPLQKALLVTTETADTFAATAVTLASQFPLSHEKIARLNPGAAMATDIYNYLLLAFQPMK